LLHFPFSLRSLRLDSTSPAFLSPHDSFERIALDLSALRASGVELRV